MSRSRRFIVTFVILSLLFAAIIGIIAVARPFANAVGVPWETARAFLMLMVGIVMISGSLTFLAEQRRDYDKRKNEDVVEPEASYILGDDGELTLIEDKQKQQYR